VTRSVEFEIVDPAEVPAGGNGRGQLSPASAALLAGETIWMAGKSRATRFAVMAKPRGYRVRTRTGDRDGVKGTYIWLELVQTETA
jgi:hypothetical protein